MVEKQGAGSVGSDGGVCGVGNSTDVCNGSLELGDGNYKKKVETLTPLVWPTS